MDHDTIVSTQPQPPAQPSPSRKRPLLILALILVVLSLITAAGIFLYRAMDPYDNRILSQVSIGGLDVGGMTKGEARKALQQALEETILGQPLTVALPEETLSFSAEDVGLDVDVRQAVKAAYRYGREGNDQQKQEAFAASQAEGLQIGLLDFLEYDESVLRSQLEAYAGQYDTTLSQSGYALEGDIPELNTLDFDPEAPAPTLVLTKGYPTAKLDVEGMLEQIRRIYDSGISAGKNGTYKLDIPEIVPEETPEQLDFDAIYQELSVAPTDDSLNMETYAFVNGSYGYAFDPEAAREQFDAAEYGQTIQVSMTYTRPEILGKEVYFRDELGYCETKHNDNENRNTNLRLICEILDGLILQPGEEFSFNGVVGERTAERGFKPAPAFSGNRLANSIGGGACQTSTTLYNCVLLADLEVVTRVCHGAKVSYVPLGLDAAVNWGTTDFAFRNSSHFPIKIQAEVSDGYVKMKILGTDEKDYYIVMTSGYDDGLETVTYAVSYKNKYDKETGELISKEREAFSTYYDLG